MGIGTKLRRSIGEVRRSHMRKTGIMAEPLAWLLSRPMAGAIDLRTTPAVNPADDRELVERVCTAYRRSNLEFAPSASFWDQGIRSLNADIHDALMEGPPLATEFLRNPANNSHFWGFDSVAKAPFGKTEPHDSILKTLNPSIATTSAYALWLRDSLASLADAVGAQRAWYPEAGPSKNPPTDTQPDALLASIEDAIGLTIEFPNPYAGERGLSTSRGVASFRAIQSVYQGWRISRFAEAGRPFRVLEIGAGLGRTALFASQFGVTDYTIIDIPLTGAAQGYFLGRTIGQDRICLNGERPMENAVKIVPPAALENLGHFDLIVNVDSLTEMDGATQDIYWNFIRRSCRSFLSINHEFNKTTMRGIFRESGVEASRFPYWMRRGYVEEIVTFAR